MAIGVFGLQVAYKLKRLEVMSTDDTHGWFGGGHFNSGGSNIGVAFVKRVDFSNDTQTASIKGSLSAGRGWLSATSNSNYGWYAGGNPGTVDTALSTVDRIDFSNDSSTASPRGSLGTTKAKAAATGNSNYGWFGGGYFTGSSSNTNTTVVRIDYSNDSSLAPPRGPLVFVSSTRAATGNSNYGWFGGAGSDGSVSRIDFSNDYTTASLRGPLSAAKYNSAATGNSNYGWFGGGDSPGGISSTVNRIDFSNDTETAVERGPLSLARQFLAATGNSNYGWFAGGANPGTTEQQIIDRIDFSNDLATASPRGITAAPTKTYGLAATSGQAKGPAIKLQKGGNFGWFGGGQGDSPVVILATVDRIDFSNDTPTTSPRTGTLSLARMRLAATGNSNYGWFGGGYGPLIHQKIVDRIDFSNDSASASVRGPLITERSNLAATGNSNYGWFGGGNSGPSSVVTSQPELAVVERINFSNDSVSASVRGTLGLGKRTGLAATGNSNYGWFAGGRATVPPSPNIYYSTVERINFSNDSPTTSPRGPLNQGRHSFAATGNSNYGWFGGGLNPAYTPTTLSSIDRIDFSNDSVSALARGSLIAIRYSMGATGNSNYGWFGGGKTPTSSTNNVYRINFSNDSVATSSRGLLSSARYRHAATSNSTR